MAAQKSDASNATVRATYSSPSGTKVFEHILSSSKPNNASSKTAYMNELRSFTKELQNDANVFLTAKMEEDKAQAQTATGNTAKGKSKEEEEEETYGEEKIEED